MGHGRSRRLNSRSDSADYMSDESEIDLDTVRQSVKLRKRVAFFRSASDDSDVSEELPDGHCHRKPDCVRNKNFADTPAGVWNQYESRTGYRCEYVGSFEVADNESCSNPELQQAQLDMLRKAPLKKAVSVLVTLSGIKICSTDGKTVLMAHAVRRICWATCNPGHFQFSFLAREPKPRSAQRFCHVFRTQSPRQAEDLSSLVGSAFRMAYARQLQQQRRQQSAALGTVVSLSGLRSSSASPGASMDVPSSPDDDPTSLGQDAGCLSAPEATPPTAFTKVWAKKVAGRTKHREPMVDSFVDQNGHAVQQQLNNAVNTRRKENNLFNDVRTAASASLPGSPRHFLPLSELRRTPSGDTGLWSPSSNEDNSSPTEFNCCRKLTDKPPLGKKMEDSWQANGVQLIANVWEKTTASVVGEAAAGERKTGSHNGDASTESSNSTRAGAAHSTDTDTWSTNGSRDEGCHGAGGYTVDLPAETSSKRTSTTSTDQNLSPVLRPPPGTDATPSRTLPLPMDAKKSIFPTPAPPQRHDSLSGNLNEEQELRGAPWFQAGIPREIALEVLGQEPIGSFMVRKSTTKPGCFALSLRVPRSFQPTGISHYLIMHTNKGYKIKGFTKEFTTLTSLITHHSVMPELLPCPLSLYRYNSSFRRHGSAEDLVDIDDDPDYNLLSDFRKMMADAV
ncbi:uncharacterized protein LOC135369689 isoform X2 [Ornithodoros turicata]|uniref:uncharacterized protein LOC135369689 isoform X2 n=1 Tax=Ornithodoros turicata TaxID=34597 RepID=UPI00313A0F7D